MFVVEYLVIGFITVFGWNSGQIVWDKYIQPQSTEQQVEQHDHRK